MATDTDAVVLAVGTNTAAHDIQALPKRAPTIASRVRPFNLATLDTSGVPTAITVSVIRSSHYPWSQVSSTRGQMSDYALPNIKFSPRTSFAVR